MLQIQTSSLSVSLKKDVLNTSNTVLDYIVLVQPLVDHCLSFGYYKKLIVILTQMYIEDVIAYICYWFSMSLLPYASAKWTEINVAWLPLK